MTETSISQLATNRGVLSTLKPGDRIIVSELQDDGSRIDKIYQIPAQGVTFDADGSISIRNQNAINEMNFTGTEFTNIVSATTSGFELGTTGSGYLRFVTNNAERLRILPTGGITFNGDTAQANALDDYEEGTWTPTITGDGGSNSGQSYGTVTAHYVKIGQLVYLGFDVTLTAAGSLGGSYAVVSNLPFPTLNSNLGGGSLGYYNNISNATGPITFYAAASKAYLMKGGSTYVANSDITNNTRLLGFLSYRTSA